MDTNTTASTDTTGILSNLVSQLATNINQIPPGNGTAIKGNVSCSFSADLMNNYLAGSAIDAEHQFDVIQDSNGDPMLFSIGSPIDTGSGNSVNQLYVSFRDDSQIGWQQINISPDINSSVQVFGISQDPQNGKFVLAAAVEGANGSTVYITDILPSTIDWTSFSSSQWVTRPGTPDGAAVTKILIGKTLTDAPLVIAATEDNNQAQHYFVQGDVTKTDYPPLSNTCWTLYNEPEDATNLLDLQIGLMYINNAKQNGTYALYNIENDNQTELRLMFTAIPDGTTNISPSVSLDVPAGTVAIQTVPDKNNLDISIVIAGGNGLYIFESAPQVSAATTTPKGVAPNRLISNDAGFANVTQLIAREDASSISIWTTNNDQALYYVKGTQNSSARDWTTPLSLRQNVSRIAAYRNQNLEADTLFSIVSDNKTVAYSWQDPATTLWKEIDLTLPAISTVQEFPCYTTVMTFTDENGNPVINQNVDITASEWTYATVNGYFKSLNTAAPVSVPTDGTGKITIINKVSTASTPVFSASAAFLSETQTYNPATDLIDALQQIKTTDDLLSAKYQNTNNYVISDPNLRSDTNKLQGIVTSIQNLLANVNQTQNSNSLAPAGNSSGEIWGMSFGDSGTRFYQGTDAQNLISSANQTSVQSKSIVDEVLSAAGDVLEAMRKGFEKVTHFVVDTTEAIIKICVTMGEIVYNFVAQTVSDVLNVINWLLGQIEIDLEKLINWLGFIFEWDDIVTTHKVISNLTVQSVKYFESLLGNSEQIITTYFDGLISKVQTMPALQIPDGKDFNLLNVQTGIADNVTPQQAQQLSRIQNSPGTTFSSYQLTNSGMLTGTIPAKALPQTTTDPSTEELIKTFVADLEKTLEDFLTNCGGLITDIINLINDSELTISNLAKVISSDLLVTILELFRDLLIDLIDIVEIFVQIMLDIFTAKIPLPFISGLYESIVGSDFTLLDCLSLLIAIPTTVGYKMMSDKAPFPYDSATNSYNTFGLDTKTYSQLPQLFPTPLFPGIQPDQSLMRSASAANTEDSASTSEVDLKAYSQIGGLIYSGVQACDTGLFVFRTLSPDTLKKWDSAIDGVDIILSGIVSMTTIPTKEDTNIAAAEQSLDFCVWAGDIITNLINSFFLGQRIKAGSLMNKESDPEIKDKYKNDLGLIEDLVLPAAATIHGGFSTLFYFISLVFEVIEQDDKNGDFYAKQVQNMASGISEIGEGVTPFCKKSATGGAPTGIGIPVFIGTCFLEMGVNATNLTRDIIAFENDVQFNIR